MIFSSLVFLLGHWAQGQETVTYYVNGATGNDNRTARLATQSTTPWQTVKHAVENAEYEDETAVVIEVAPFTAGEQEGVYRERTITIRKPVIIQTPDNEEGAVIRNVDDILFTVNIDEGAPRNVFIGGFVLEDTTGFESTTAIRVQQVDTLTVFGNTIRGFSAAGIGVVDQFNKLFASENIIINNNSGILISDGIDFTPDAFTILSNSFSDNALAINNQNLNLVIADYNWWGSRSSAGVRAAVGAETLAAVDYSPWLNSGTDEEAFSPGFQSELSSFSLDISSPRQVADRNELQEAFDSENIEANDSLFLVGNPLNQPYESLIARKPIKLVVDTTTINYLTLDFSSAEQPNDTLEIIGQLTVGDSLVLNPGNLKTVGSSEVILGTNVGGVRESNGRMVGKFAAERQVGTERLAILGVDILRGEANIGRVAVTRFTGPAGVVTEAMGGEENSSIAAKWIIDVEQEPESGRALRLTWHQSFDNNKDYTRAVVWRQPSEGEEWEAASTDVNASPPDSNPDFRTITINNVTEFSTWTVSDINAPLPVTLTDLTARLDARSVRLDWSTASETNSDYFSIERSTDGHTYETLARSKAAGDSQSERHYHYIDEGVANRLAGVVYYRLHMVDFDGSSEYSPVVAVSLAGEAALRVYANHEDGAFTLFAHLPEAAYTVQVSDLLGNIVYETYLPTRPDLQEYPLPAPTLPQSVYLLRCRSNREMLISKFRVE